LSTYLGTCQIEYSSRISYSLGGSSSKYLSKPLVFRFKKISSGPMSIEINGKSVITCSNCNSTITSTETSALRVGRFFTGTIGEIIIFNRALNNAESKAVSDYLIKKWSIVD